MFIRYNSTAKYYEYDTSAAQNGSGPWVILPLSGHPSNPLPPNVAYIDTDNHFQFGQTINGGVAASTFVNAVDITGSASVSSDRMDSRGSFGRFVSIDLPGPVNQRFWTMGQMNHDGNLYFQTADDGYVGQANIIVMARTGIITFTANYTEHRSGAYFPVAQSNPALLDHFEEGNWTPSLQGEQAAATGQAYSIRIGNYIKIGRQVFAQFGLSISNVGTGGSGNLIISGFPFSHEVQNSAMAASPYISYFASLQGAVVSINPLFPNGLTYCHMYYKSASSTGMDGLLSYANLNNATGIYGSVTYIAAS